MSYELGLGGSTLVGSQDAITLEVVGFFEKLCSSNNGSLGGLKVLSATALVDLLERSMRKK